MLSRFLVFIIVTLILPLSVSADITIEGGDVGDGGGLGFNGNYPDGTIASSGFNLIGFLTLIQAFLLKVVVPILVVGVGIYIAYELFTAEGDETKMKKAWKSLTYAAVGLVVIAASYAFVSLASHLSL